MHQGTGLARDTRRKINGVKGIALNKLCFTIITNLVYKK